MTNDTGDRAAQDRQLRELAVHYPRLHVVPRANGSLRCYPLDHEGRARCLILIDADGRVVKS